MTELKPCAIINVSATEAIELLDVEYGIDDNAVYRWLTSTRQGYIRRAKLYYTKAGDAYFISDGRRYHMKDAMRIS